MVLCEVFGLAVNQVASEHLENEYCVIIDPMTTSLHPPPQVKKVYFLQSVTGMFLSGKKEIM